MKYNKILIYFFKLKKAIQVYDTMRYFHNLIDVDKLVGIVKLMAHKYEEDITSVHSETVSINNKY